MSAELAERIARAVPGDGCREPQPGLRLYRRSIAGERVYSFAEPAFCVIAQGSKVIFIGPNGFRYDPAQYLISTLGVPMCAEIVQASRARPYLSLKLVLDPAVVTSVIVESGLGPIGGEGEMLAVDVSPLDASLLDATVRLIRLLDSQDEYRMLAPLVIREIVYRLVTGAQAHRLRHLVTGDRRARRIVRAVETIRENFAKPLRIEAIARQLGMSASGFHAHFKAATAMTPLQFQKHLRLQEARRLMISEAVAAAQAGYRVGYEDPSHFTRDYKRHFGEPPIRDVERLRASIV